MGNRRRSIRISGLSAHQELAELVEAGFSPTQALLTASRNSGSFHRGHFSQRFSRWHRFARL